MIKDFANLSDEERLEKLLALQKQLKGLTGVSEQRLKQIAQQIKSLKRKLV